MEKWTAEQSEAISSRGKNLLVSAAAGSGKTAVLVERILKLVIDDRIDIDKLLIVTFTNAAASEMRERISSAIARELEKGDENESNLRRQMTLLSKASISTLHSFCIQILRKNYYVLGIDPVFKIGDQAELLLLRKAALEEILEKAYSEETPEFIELVEAYTENKSDKKIEDMILSIYFFIQSQPYPYQWLETKVNDFKMNMDGFVESYWLKVIERSVSIEIEAVLDLIEEAEHICEMPGGPEPYIEALSADKRQIQEFKERFSKYFAGKENYVNLSFAPQKLNSIRKNDAIDETLKEQVKKLRDDYKKIMTRLKTDIFSKDLNKYLADINELYPRMTALLALIGDLHKAYQRKKLEKGLLDFNDLEQYALKILENEEIAEVYRENYKYIFVDEYQDSNIVQETILNRIKDVNNLFFVGDVKQSIYRFRLADPGLFIEKYLEYSLDNSILDKRIDLSKNFRSRKEILDGVNYIFKQLMSKELGEIDYTDEAKLYPGADYKEICDPEIELDIIEKGEETGNDEEIAEAQEYELQDLSDAECEAYYITGKIKGLLEQDTYDIKSREYRKIRYRDIVILLRYAKN